VGIIRSPVRALIPPDCGGRPAMGVPTAIFTQSPDSRLRTAPFRTRIVARDGGGAVGNATEPSGHPIVSAAREPPTAPQPTARRLGGIDIRCPHPSRQTPCERRWISTPPFCERSRLFTKEKAGQWGRLSASCLPKRWLDAVRRARRHRSAGLLAT